MTVVNYWALYFATRYCEVARRSNLILVVYSENEIATNDEESFLTMTAGIGKRKTCLFRKACSMIGRPCEEARRGNLIL